MKLEWRRQMGGIAFGAIALTAIGVCWHFFDTSRQAASSAHEGLREIRRLIEDIERLKNVPRIASLRVESPDRIAAKVTIAAATAELSSLSIQSVEPQPPVRIEQSDYQIRATTIVLQDASLAQIARFAFGLEERDSGSVVRDLTIRRSQVNAIADERWDARLTLTQMIFSPISPR